MASDSLVHCMLCGRPGARDDMFGLEPDLLCEPCATGVRARMQVRVRPINRDRRPVVTLTMLGIAVVLFVLDKYVHPNPRLGPGVWPAWWESVYMNLHVSPRVWDGDVWTLLGSAFFHGGLIHIFFNCWWIWELGRATESGFGRLTLIAVTVGSAMVASGVEWAVNGPGVGLSGVVYGLAFFLWAHHKTNPHAAAIMNRRTINFLGMWFLLCIVLTMAGTWNIANWAHGGGGVWGWGVGLAMVHRQRRLLVPLAVVGTIVLLWAVTFVTVGKQTKLRELDRPYAARGVDERQRLVNWFNNRHGLRGGE